MCSHRIHTCVWKGKEVGVCEWKMENRNRRWHQHTVHRLRMPFSRKMCRISTATRCWLSWIWQVRVPASFYATQRHSSIVAAHRLWTASVWTLELSGQGQCKFWAWIFVRWPAPAWMWCPLWTPGPQWTAGCRQVLTSDDGWCPVWWFADTPAPWPRSSQKSHRTRICRWSWCSCKSTICKKWLG